MDGVRFARVGGAVREEQTAAAVDKLGHMFERGLPEQAPLVRVGTEYVRERVPGGVDGTSWVIPPVRPPTQNIPNGAKYAASTINPLDGTAV